MQAVFDTYLVGRRHAILAASFIAQTMGTAEGDWPRAAEDGAGDGGSSVTAARSPLLGPLVQDSEREMGHPPQRPPSIL